MTGVLIPIRVSMPHVMAAVRYALEFGKRNNARLYFLFVADQNEAPCAPEHEGGSGPQNAAEIFMEEFKAITGPGRSNERVRMETHFRSGDFIQEVRQFARDHYVTEIVISLPEEYDDMFAQTGKEIQLLLKMTHCRILTVKQKSRGLS